MDVTVGVARERSFTAQWSYLHRSNFAASHHYKWHINMSENFVRGIKKPQINDIGCISQKGRRIPVK